MIDEFLKVVIGDLLVGGLKLIFSTPFVLVLAFFGKDPYFVNLKTYYKKVWTWRPSSLIRR
jgi:hypothetical protein